MTLLIFGVDKSRLAGKRIAQDSAHGVQDFDDARFGKVINDRRSFAPGHHQVTLAQDLQVAGGGRLGHVQIGGQLAHVARPVVQGVEDEQPLRVAQRLADAGVQQIQFIDRRLFHAHDPMYSDRRIHEYFTPESVAPPVTFVTRRA